MSQLFILCGLLFLDSSKHYHLNVCVATLYIVSGVRCAGPRSGYLILFNCFKKRATSTRSFLRGALNGPNQTTTENVGAEVSSILALSTYSGCSVPSSSSEVPRLERPPRSGKTAHREKWDGCPVRSVRWSDLPDRRRSQ
jgi:hypothetical protein